MSYTVLHRDALPPLSLARRRAAGPRRSDDSAPRPSAPRPSDGMVVDWKRQHPSPWPGNKTSVTVRSRVLETGLLRPLQQSPKSRPPIGSMHSCASPGHLPFVQPEHSGILRPSTGNRSSFLPDPISLQACRLQDRRASCRRRQSG
jgi:hypothetical protein